MDNQFFVYVWMGGAISYESYSKQDKQVCIYKKDIKKHCLIWVYPCPTNSQTKKFLRV